MTSRWQCHQPYCSFCVWFPARQECQCSSMASKEPGSQSHWVRLGPVGSEGEGLGHSPPEMSWNLQVPWWKSGVRSHSNNWHIWCSPWGGDALQYLMQLVATPDTDCYFWFWPTLCSGTHYSISISHMSVELVQLVSVVESCCVNICMNTC